MAFGPPGRSRWLTAILACALGAGLVCAWGCAPRPVESGRIPVAVTLLPQAGLVDVIGGDRVDVTVMVPPGASPHTYELTPDQMVRLSRAQAYFKVGTPVEFELSWMDRLIAANRTMLVVDCSEGIELLQDSGFAEPSEVQTGESTGAGQHHEVGADPHIWLSVRNAATMAAHIRDGLVRVDPQGEELYRENYEVFAASLAALDEELRATLAAVAIRHFIVFHPSFGYFARDYDLMQIAVEQGGSEPDAAYLIRLVEQAKEHGIRIVFAAPQFSSRSAEVIAREIGGEVVTIDPLARDYIENIRHIAHALAQLT